MTRPKKFGISTDALTPESTIPQPPQKQRKLQDLAQDYAFVSPALVVTHGGFDRDPFGEFSRHYPRGEKDLQIRVVQLDAPFATGLPVWRIPDRGTELQLNRTLFLVPKVRLPELELFFRLLRWIDLRTGEVRVCLWRTYDVLDREALRRGGPVDAPPRLPVHVVGVRSELGYDIDMRFVGELLVVRSTQGQTNEDRGFNPFPGEYRHYRGADTPLPTEVSGTEEAGGDRARPGVG